MDDSYPRPTSAGLAATEPRDAALDLTLSLSEGRQITFKAHNTGMVHVNAVDPGQGTVALALDSTQIRALRNALTRYCWEEPLAKEPERGGPPPIG